MVSEGVKIVVGVSKSLLEEKEKTKKMNVKRVLAQWKEEGLIHEIYPFDNDVIRKLLLSNKAGGLWLGVFNKLLLYNLTDYDKLIRLDNDILIRRNIRYWFDYDTPCGVQAHDQLEWNLGAMVITPNQTILQDMLAKLPYVVKRHAKPHVDKPYAKPRTDFKLKKALVNLTEPDGWNSGIGKQGFLSSYFTTSIDPALRMKTMPMENSIAISSLILPQQD